MIYIIISNVGMALMMLFIYFRYSRFRISSASEIKDLRKKNEAQAEEIKNADNKLLQATKADSEKVQSLLSEANELRKEKENEIKLRMNAEKQLELTMQKISDTEKRIKDWSVLQDAMMKDCKEVMLKIGNDLFKKLNDNYKLGVETNKNLIGKLTKNIDDFSSKFSRDESAANPQELKPKASSPEIKKNEISNPNNAEIRIEGAAKKLVFDLLETIKASGHLANKNYFTPANFDPQKAKLLLCEIAFLSSGDLYIIDFKACQYFAEYEKLKVKDKLVAENNLKQKLDKYFAYLANVKYRESILKALSASKVKFEKSIISVVLPSKNEIQILKEIHYYEKANKLNFEVFDSDGINNIVL